MYEYILNLNLYICWKCKGYIYIYIHVYTYRVYKKFRDNKISRKLSILFTGAISLILGGVAKVRVISRKSFQFFKMKHSIFDSIIE